MVGYLTRYFYIMLTYLKTDRKTNKTPSGYESSDLLNCPDKSIFKPTKLITGLQLHQIQSLGIYYQLCLILDNLNCNDISCLIVVRYKLLNLWELAEQLVQLLLVVSLLLPSELSQPLLAVFLLLPFELFQLLLVVSLLRLFVQLAQPLPVAFLPQPSQPLQLF